MWDILFDARKSVKIPVIDENTAVGAEEVSKYSNLSE